MRWFTRKPDPIEDRIRQYLIDEHYRRLNDAYDVKTDYNMGALDEAARIIGDVQEICEGGKK